MKANILIFGYLFLRLAPFILVCFFALSSIFNQDLKGIIYLVGLVFTCFVNMMVSNVFTKPDHGEGKSNVCSIISIDGSEDLSLLPIGQTIFGYTSGYLGYFIIKNDLLYQNIATFIFFPFIVFIDIIWNLTNSCYTIDVLIIALAIGLILGIIWGEIINSTNSPSLQYLVGKNVSNDVCQAPSKQTFKCSVYKNGKLVTQ